ncbi:COMPASS (complex proteins associated with Set1p) component [Elasticomyces elasticus]|nr:COMPASS (complex proteins associated with Set1p) component [Elasticomyces elasticus]
MSFSLSSLLNPAPAPDQSSQEPRRESLPALQLVQSPEAGDAAQYTPSHHSSTYPSTTAHEAAQALAALAGGSMPAPAPASGGGYNDDNGSVHSKEHYGSDRRSSEARQGGAFRHGATPVEPSPATDKTRQGSSPTLEQYHVGSRSPEQQRRQSVIAAHSSAFTLPPIQSLTSGGDEMPRVREEMHGQAFSHYVSPPAGNVEQAKSVEQQEGQALYLETSYTRNEPATTQIRGPSLAPETSVDTGAQRQATVAPAIQTNAISTMPHIKDEPVGTPRGSTPNSDTRPNLAQIPPPDTQTLRAVAQLKNEHGLRAHSPLRESSIPMPSTEMAAPSSTTAPIANPKKRPAPKNVKKGTASTVKKQPPSKKRRIESAANVSNAKGSTTPGSRASNTPISRGGAAKPKKGPSGSATPADSSPAPDLRSQRSTPSRLQSSSPAEEDDDDPPDGDIDPDAEVYCLCRRPDTGTFMVGCDGPCGDWFHGKCVGVDSRDKELIDRFICPNCESAAQGKSRTTYKRMCRRPGCRLPALVGGKKGGQSKYCSEACGVLFFSDMFEKPKTQRMPKKGSRRKGSLSSDVLDGEEELGSRGGVLTARELKTLIDSVNTVEEFKSLGAGVLSPPETPYTSPTVGSNPNPAQNQDSGLTEQDLAQLAHIDSQKDATRRRHALLKDRIKFIGLAKQAATRRAEEEGVKLRDFCGFDAKISLSEEGFERWRSSKSGRTALKLGTLEPPSGGGADETDTQDDGAGEDADADVDEEMDEAEVCQRKKCARHLEWAKLALDETRFEIGENSERMRALEREDKEIRERARLRKRQSAGREREGVVEVHGDVGGDGGDGDGKMEDAQDGELGSGKGEVPAQSSNDVELAAQTQMLGVVAEAGPEATAV